MENCDQFAGQDPFAGRVAAVAIPAGKRGVARMLTRVLQHRFGPVPTWVSEKIAGADLSSLEEWNFRLIEAQSLDAVFFDPE
ncbi:MAG: Transposase [Magnetococcales bacterium]|nr:Transposase [Magnetococcales bacterium]HIJ84054.1 hypothetical protein [Magnetococcales bacterium]